MTTATLPKSINPSSLESLLKRLICTVCKSGEIRVLKDKLQCPECATEYDFDAERIHVDMMPPERHLMRCYDDAYLHWQLVQSNELLVYQDDVQNNNSTHTWMPKSHDVLREWLANSSDILDIGCGIDQSMQDYFSKDGYVGLDPLPQQSASSRIVVKGMAEFIPFRSGSFDTVLLHSSFDHLIDSNRSLAELLRVLKDSGRFILSQCVYFPPEIDGHRRLSREPRDPWHFRWMTQDKLVSIVDGAGFSIEKSVVVIPEKLSNWGVLLLSAQKLPFRGLPFTNIGDRRPKQTPPFYPSPDVQPWRTLIFGAGAAAVNFISEIQSYPFIELVGVVDNDGEREGSLLNGYRVFGPEQICKLPLDSIVICSQPGRVEITEQLEALGYIHLVNFFTDEEFMNRLHGNFTDQVVRL